MVPAVQLLGEADVAAAAAAVAIDVDVQPLFRYWGDAPGSIDSLAFGRVVRLGTIAAMRYAVLRSDGVAVLPRYFVADDLRARRLLPILPRVEPLADWFRLLIRSDDPRRSVFERIAAAMRARPLR